MVDIHIDAQYLVVVEVRPYTRCMERSVSELLRDAQQLSHQDLTDLVHELLHALEASDSADEATDAEGAEKAWTSEALQRLEEIEDGSVHSVDGPNALESVREQLAAHRR